MSWIFLFVAGLAEIGWAIGLKYSQGFTKPVASTITIGLMIVSFIFLSQALKTIPLGTAYAVWTGIGALGTAIVGIMLFNEPKDALRLFFIFTIFVGIVGLKLVSK